MRRTQPNSNTDQAKSLAMGFKGWMNTLVPRPNASQGRAHNTSTAGATKPLRSQSPELLLSSESSGQTTVSCMSVLRSTELTSSTQRSSLTMGSGSSGRPVRATRGKRTSLAAGFIDPSTVKIDSDDEGDDYGYARLTKKARFGSSSDIEDEEDFQTARSPNSAAASSSASSNCSPSPEPEPEPMPWELKFYPKTNESVENFMKIVGPPPPDTDDLDKAVRAVTNAWLPEHLKSKTSEPIRFIVKLRLPPGTIDKNASFDPNKVGFMDLPGELRNKVYLLAFKDKKQVEFKSRNGFPHSAAFLRVNKTVYNEGRTILYGQNRFVFDQSTYRVGEYYEHQWKEMNYSHIRKFLTDIGPGNTSLITNVGLNLEDATPSGHPGTTMNARRFEHNKDLYWILKHLARHSKLEKLKLGFAGRRVMHLVRSEAAFLHALAAVKTDDLAFGDPHTESTGEDLWDRMHYCKLDDNLKKTLEGVMKRPMPLRLLDPRLQF